jgi:hypothetical protein
MDKDAGGGDGGGPPSPNWERRVYIKPPSDHDDLESLARLASAVEALCAAWRRLPPPAKVLAWAAVLALVAPPLRRAADSLGIEPSELLQLVNGPE